MGMKEIEIAVIVNSFNRKPLLQKALSSLVDVLKGINRYSIVIYDAHSTDGTIGYIHEFIERHKALNIDLIFPSEGEPDSFSHGVNAACAYALKKYPSVRYFFLYETDNFISSIEPLVQAEKLLEREEQLAACGFTVQKHNGAPAGFGSSFPGIASLILGQQFAFSLSLHEGPVSWIRNDICEYAFSDVVYTSPLLIKARSWEKIKGFDSVNFPFSDCDIDLAYRLRKQGERMAVIVSGSVVHDNLEMQSSWSATRTINFHRGRMTYFKKHYGKVIDFLKPLIFMSHLTELCLLAGMVLLGKKKSNSLKTRWTLLKSVFADYNVKA